MTVISSNRNVQTDVTGQDAAIESSGDVGQFTASVESSFADTDMEYGAAWGTHSSNLLSNRFSMAGRLYGGSSGEGPASSTHASITFDVDEPTAFKLDAVVSDHSGGLYTYDPTLHKLLHTTVKLARNGEPALIDAEGSGSVQPSDDGPPTYQQFRVQHNLDLQPGRWTLTFESVGQATYYEQFYDGEYSVVFAEAVPLPATAWLALGTLGATMVFRRQWWRVIA